MARRRKSRKVKPPKPKWAVAKLDKKFRCPFCNDPDSVECKFDRKLRFAVVQCCLCGEHYSTTFHHLTEPIDVYSEWIDECEKANLNVNSSSY